MITGIIVSVFVFVFQIVELVLRTVFGFLRVIVRSFGFWGIVGALILLAIVKAAFPFIVAGLVIFFLWPHLKKLAHTKEQ